MRGSFHDHCLPKDCHPPRNNGTTGQRRKWSTGEGTHWLGFSLNLHLIYPGFEDVAQLRVARKTTSTAKQNHAKVLAGVLGFRNALQEKEEYGSHPVWGSRMRELNLPSHLGNKKTGTLHALLGGHLLWMVAKSISHHRSNALEWSDSQHKCQHTVVSTMVSQVV